MAQVAGTTDTYDLNGLREQVENVIHDISPMDTPFLTRAGRGKAEATFYQWQTDQIEAPGTNRQIEGDDASYATITPTTMLGNSTQISRKTLIISRTADRVKKYGRGAELAYQLVKKGKALKRDVEWALVRNQGSSSGGNATARSCAGIEAMVPSANTVRPTGNTGGSTPGYAGGAWGAPVDGTVGANSTFSEAYLQSALERVYVAGGESPIVMSNTAQKRAAGQFQGAAKFAGNYVDSGRKQLGVVVGGVDMYISDYGDHRFVLNRWMRQSVVLLLDFSGISVAWLDGYKTEELAKTGDAEKRMIICEYTLQVDNPDGQGKIVDLYVPA